MAQHIHVVLTEDMPSIGNSGELVKVRPGFARNYLIPRGLAIGATTDNVARIEHAKRVAESKAAKTKAEAEELGKKLAEVKLTITRQTGEGDKLYGAVTTRDVEEALAQLGFSVDRRRIACEPMKALGTYQATVRLGPNISTQIEVNVVAK